MLKKHILHRSLVLLALLASISGCANSYGKLGVKEDAKVRSTPLADSKDPVAQLARALGKDLEIIQSPNYGERRGPGQGKRPTELMIHYTACEKERVVALFKKPDNVASHYLVDRQGNITRFVEESKRAWHAGGGAWHGNTDVNSTSIGIENINLGYKHQEGHPPGQKVGGASEEWYPYDEALLHTLGPLCKDIVERYEIKPNNVIGHSDMTTIRATGFLGRKVDPGPLFPWERLHSTYDVGAWHNLKESLERVEFPHRNQTEWVREHLIKYGYPHPETWNEENTQKAVKTFQMHFRPSNISGEIDEETIRILASLVDRYIEAEN